MNQVYFNSVELKTPYTLEIKCFIRVLDVNKEFTIIYSGTEVRVDAPVTEGDLQDIKVELNNLIGYGPFELDKADRILKEKVSISIRN